MARPLHEDAVIGFERGFEDMEDGDMGEDVAGTDPADGEPEEAAQKIDGGRHESGFKKIDAHRQCFLFAVLERQGRGGGVTRPALRVP